MPRYIDAEALKKDLTRFYDNEVTAKELIDGQPTIEAEPVNSWISVKDRLPDDKERYLICTEGGRIDIAYYQPTGDKFSDYEPFWQGSSCRFTSVTHWQPLPEPPKSECG